MHTIDTCEHKLLHSAMQYTIVDRAAGIFLHNTFYRPHRPKSAAAGRIPRDGLLLHPTRRVAALSYPSSRSLRHHIRTDFLLSGARMAVLVCMDVFYIHSHIICYCEQYIHIQYMQCIVLCTLLLCPFIKVPQQLSIVLIMNNEQCIIHT